MHPHAVNRDPPAPHIHAVGRYVSADLEPVRESSSRARHLTREHATEWGVAHLADDAELIAAELVANAVAAVPDGSPGPCIIFSVQLTPPDLRIVVWDSGPGTPAKAAGFSDAGESGRGLLIVDALSRDWDWWPTPGSGGKVVRASLPAGP
jgi:anti-sigma regulatory factor (Ser/Thr protein kinase)